MAYDKEVERTAWKWSKTFWKKAERFLMKNPKHYHKYLQLCGSDADDYLVKVMKKEGRGMSKLRERIYDGVYCPFCKNYIFPRQEKCLRLALKQIKALKDIIYMRDAKILSLEAITKLPKHKRQPKEGSRG